MAFMSYVAYFTSKIKGLTDCKRTTNCIVFVRRASPSISHGYCDSCWYEATAYARDVQKKKQLERTCSVYPDPHLQNDIRSGLALVLKRQKDQEDRTRRQILAQNVSRNISAVSRAPLS